MAKFHRAKKLYYELVKAQASNDQIKWFSLITQVENYEYIINNIDYRLGKDLNNIELWKLYIDFLKYRNTEVSQTEKA